LLGQAQQALDPALLPAQAQQAQRNRQQGRQGKTPAGIERGANHEAQLADQNKRQPVLQHRQPLVALGHRRLAAIEAQVQGFGAADLLGRRLDPHRLVTHHTLVFENRGYISVDPIVVAVLAAVFDDAHPRRTLFQGAPHMLEDCGRHVRVAHQIVRRTYQLLTRKSADFPERIVAVGDDAFGIGRGNQPLLRGKCAFALSDGLVITHVVSIRKTLTGCRHGSGIV